MSGNGPAGRKSGRTGSGIDANLIQFPRANMQYSETGEPIEPVPTWRTEVREKVRQFRAQRAAVAAQEEDLAALDLPANPVVEAALKRLKRPAEDPPDRTTRPLKKPAPAIKPDPDTARRSEEKPAIEGMKSPVHPTTVPAQASQPSTALAITEPVLEAEPVLSSATFLDEFEDISEARLLPPKPRREEVKSRERIPPGGHDQGPATAATVAAADATSHKPQTRIITASDDADLYPLPAALPTRDTSPVSLWNRTMAWICDLALLFFVSLPIIGVDAVMAAIDDQQRIVPLAAQFSWIAVAYYLVTLWAGGKTCGMAWRDIRVTAVTNPDQPLAAWRVIVRSVASTIATLAPPINWIFIWVSGNQSSLADLASGTVIEPDRCTDPIGDKPSTRLT